MDTVLSLYVYFTSLPIVRLGLDLLHGLVSPIYYITLLSRLREALPYTYENVNQYMNDGYRSLYYVIDISLTVWGGHINETWVSMMAALSKTLATYGYTFNPTGISTNDWS
jgi:hypothetical protein